MRRQLCKQQCAYTPALLWAALRISIFSPFSLPSSAAPRFTLLHLKCRQFYNLDVT